MSRSLSIAGVLVATLATTVAPAQDAPPKSEAPKSEAPKSEAPKSEAPTPRCAARGSSLAAIARELAAGLGRVPAGATVMTLPLTSDEDVRRGDDLAGLVAEQLAGRLGAAVEPAPMGEEAARGAARAPGIVLLRPRIEGGRLRVVADTYPIAASVWAKASQRRGPTAHAHAHGPIDAEIRSYLAPLGIGDAKVARFEGADPEIEALACGDLDGDGETDVVTVNRQRVLRVRLRDGRVERLVEAVWDALSPVAPAPLREPIGFATIDDGAGTIDVALSDRRGSVRLDAELGKLAELPGMAIPHGRTTACAPIYDLRLAPKLAPCADRDPLPAIADLRHAADAMASSVLVARDGEARTVVALRRDGTLILRDGDRDSHVARVGAQIAVGDLDQDGAPELVSTIDTLAPKHDAVEIRTLEASGTVKVRRRVPVPTGVEAVAVCPPDRPASPAPVIVATAGQIWVLR